MIGSPIQYILHTTMATVTREAMRILQQFSLAAAPVAVGALWQGAIVATGLGVCMRLARRVSAEYRFAIWASGFAALVCMPFLTAWAAGTVANPNTDRVASAVPLLRLDPRWSLLIGMVWVQLSLVRMAGLTIHALRLRRLWNSAGPIQQTESEHSLASEAKPRLPGILAFNKKFLRGYVRREAEICTTKELDRPVVIGFLSPRILIPEWLLERLSPEEFKHVVLHETEHLRRCDDWINLAQKVCLVLFPLNPALLWLDSKLCREREMACDEGVVRVTKAPRAYAACLASLAERGLSHRAELLSLGAWRRRSELVERVHRILRRNQRLSPIATRVLAGALSCGLVVGSIELAHSPQLVAFAPAPQAVAQVRATDNDDVIYGSGNGAAEDGATGFRAANAVAVKSAAGMRAVNQVSRVSTAKRSNQKLAGASDDTQLHAPRMTLLKAGLSNSKGTEREEHAKTVWIVFRAWRQIESSATAHRGWNSDSGMRQDYDSQTTDEGEVSHGFAITHLIFTMYQPMASAAGTQTPQSADIANSNSELSDSSDDQSTANSLRDGWFVFQL